MDFCKASHTVPRAQLKHRLHTMGVLYELTRGIVSLYESVSDTVRTLEGDSNLIYSTIGVKQGCPLSPTLFGLYIDEVYKLMDRGGGKGSPLARVHIPLLLYANDIALIADSLVETRRHLEALPLH